MDRQGHLARAACNSRAARWRGPAERLRLDGVGARFGGDVLLRAVEHRMGDGN
jgi:hypothetical protein